MIFDFGGKGGHAGGRPHTFFPRLPIAQAASLPAGGPDGKNYSCFNYILLSYLFEIFQKLPDLHPQMDAFNVIHAFVRIHFIDVGG